MADRTELFARRSRLRIIGLVSLATRNYMLAVALATVGRGSPAEIALLVERAGSGVGLRVGPRLASLPGGRVWIVSRMLEDPELPEPDLEARAPARAAGGRFP